MSGPILFGADLVALPSARIARGDVRALRDAGELLIEAQAIRDTAQAASDAARAEGYAAGKAAALAEFNDALGAALADLAAGFTQENQRREREVAAAAIAVIEQLIGARAPDEVVAGLAAQALRKAGASDDAKGEDCVVEVAPDHAEPVRQRLADARHPVRVLANPALAPLACRVLTGEGRIIADLDTQLASLRQRWGVDAAEQAQP
jgi:flagellar biosynthesis/type III secretory pathway protein FliH